MALRAAEVPDRKESKEARPALRALPGPRDSALLHPVAGEALLLAGEALDRKKNQGAG